MSDKEIINSGYFHIKPAARHILTVGKGIIKDSYTAILELVKNSYDADAKNVFIKLIVKNNQTYITIEDDGHGMDYETVIKKWMVPSTADKVRQKRSRYKERPLQGRKGIGRYAASILGDDLSLKTTDKEDLTTTELSINWNDFLTDEKYLEDIELFIENYKDLNLSQGTKLKITGTNPWSDKDLDELLRSLKMLLSPFEEAGDEFKILLQIENEKSEKYKFFSETIKPFPILDYFHYRISGTIKLLKIDDRKFIRADLTLENKRLANTLPQKLQKEIVFRNGEKYCGQLRIDIRAYDLDDLDELKIDDPIVKAEEIKNLIRTQLPGVAIIREKFRVRPYGDRKNDWLSLNVSRFNNPSLRLSNNQVAGYVFVEQEETSNLEENATREGFKENQFYEGLKTSIKECLGVLEEYRFKFRRQQGKGKKKKKTIEEQIREASSYTDLNEKINNLLNIANVAANVKTEISDVIQKEAKVKEEQFEEIKKTIAQYQGQVTLGRILTVVLHEGRKPLNALKHHPEFITEWSKDLVRLVNDSCDTDDESISVLLDKIIDRLNDNKHQAAIFSTIFKKIEPLASNKRSSPKEFNLKKTINDAFKLYEYELSEKGIDCEVVGNTELKIIGWELDFNMAFANLIENSIYWMESSETKNIEVIIQEESEKILIDYSDTGSGINEDNITNQDIFDPGYSTKQEGTGLGLSIAGEALERNRAKIKAVSSNTGANFIIEITK